MGGNVPNGSAFVVIRWKMTDEAGWGAKGLKGNKRNTNWFTAEKLLPSSMDQGTGECINGVPCRTQRELVKQAWSKQENHGKGREQV